MNTDLTTMEELPEALENFNTKMAATDGLNMAFIPTISAFLDYEKTFNKVIRNKVWQSMIEKCFPQHLA